MNAVDPASILQASCVEDMIDHHKGLVHRGRTEKSIRTLNVNGVDDNNNNNEASDDETGKSRRDRTCIFSTCTFKANKTMAIVSPPVELP